MSRWKRPAWEVSSPSSPAPLRARTRARDVVDRSEESAAEESHADSTHDCDYSGDDEHDSGSCCSWSEDCSLDGDAPPDADAM